MKDSGVEWIGEIPEQWKFKVNFVIIIVIIDCKDYPISEEGLSYR